MRPGCVRARKNMACISAGILSNVVSCVSGASGNDSFFCLLDSSGWDVCFGNNFSIICAMNFGTGRANNGFPVLITMVVVAIYNGMHANTIKQNANPPRPCKCACATRCQCRDENISKLNNMCINAHVRNI